MRKGNLEFRKCSYIGAPPNPISYEICVWQPNMYYGKEQDYIKKNNYYIPKDSIDKYFKIHKDCFKNPETCYQIGIFRYDKHDDMYEFSFCGDRPLDSIVDWNIFRELIEYGFNKLNNGTD